MAKAVNDQERRVEIGRQRREKTRGGIIETALQVVRERGADDLMLEHFIAAAGVAKGTFYNHFPTKSDLLSALASHVADAIDDQILPVINGVANPAQRIATACQLFIHMSRTRPEWGWILVRSMPGVNVGWSHGMQKGALADIRAGVRQGIFQVPSVQVAMVVSMGILSRAIQTVLTNKMPPKFGQSVAEMILRAMGMSHEEAYRIANMPLNKP